MFPERLVVEIDRVIGNAVAVVFHSSCREGTASYASDQRFGGTIGVLKAKAHPDLRAGTGPAPALGCGAFDVRASDVCRRQPSHEAAAEDKHGKFQRRDIYLVVNELQERRELI